MARNVALKHVNDRLKRRLDSVIKSSDNTIKDNGLKVNITEINKRLRDDNKNFLNHNKKIEFNYPHQKLSEVKSGENYNSLISNKDLSDTDKAYFIIKDKLVKAYKHLKADAEFEKQVKNQTIRRCFCYNYFNNLQPRCSFCGQILEETEDKKGNKYIHADIEHIFPKSIYPQFALCINNFAPACKECNQGEKIDSFFNNKIDFYTALKELNITLSQPFKLWENIELNFSSFEGSPIKIKKGSKAFDLLEFYGLNKRYAIIKNKLYNNLFNRIKHANIKTPEALEYYLSGLFMANLDELNDGYSLNNSPKIWHDFIDWVLYDECNLLALWDELKEYSRTQLFF